MSPVRKATAPKVCPGAPSKPKRKPHRTPSFKRNIFTKRKRKTPLLNLQKEGFQVGEEVRVMPPPPGTGYAKLTVTGPTTAEDTDEVKYTFVSAVGPTLMFTKHVKMFGCEKPRKEHGYKLLLLPDEEKAHSASNLHGLKLVY